MRQLIPPPTAPPPAAVDDERGFPDLSAFYAPPEGLTRHLRVNFVASLDGAVEVGGRSGPLGGPADKYVFHTLRALADVVLVGAGTARVENYGPVKIPGRAVRDIPPLALVTKSVDLSPKARFFTELGPRPVIITCATATVPRWVAEQADVVCAGDDAVDLPAALDALARRGLGRVLCEGGPRLFADLSTANLVDEVCLTIAPLLAGPGRRTVLAGPPWIRPQQLELLSTLEHEGVLLLRYAVQRAPRASA